ncbi:DUF4855 domain-containing protein [Alicyclobacillus fodiniaquatilis]|uniref:DUF4855 domain-containing protein n=1 Tax=Alicyclobacillus fodiniaquatilis TaxID=1661150 RepID=A0ABW4JE15_9BACL
MRTSAVAAVTALILLGGPCFAGTAYADTGSSTTSSSSTGSAQAPMGDQTEVARPGADPNNPNDYPYLPPNMSIPVPGPRTEYPLAPSTTSTSSGGSASSATSSTTTSTSTNSAGSTSGETASSTIMSPSDIAKTPPKNTDTTTLPDMAIGKPYTIGTQWPDPTFEQSEVAYANTGQLTDGQFASLDYADKGWVGLLRQGGRSVVVNLGSVQPIRRVSLDFLQNLGAGIDFPDSVTYYVSNDGDTWHKIGTVWSGQGGGDYTPQSQPYSLDTHVNAQYVRAQFDDKVFSFMDEFSVFGTPQSNQSGGQGTGAVGQSTVGSSDTDGGGTNGNNNPARTQPLPGPAITKTMGDDYLVDENAPGLPNLLQAVSTIASPSGPSGPQGPSTAQSLLSLAALGLAQGAAQLNPYLTGAANLSGYLKASDPETDGIQNMQLVYTGANGSAGEWSESDFLPMIAQENASGVPTGWLFDGTLFGEYSAQTPQTEAGWTSWLSDLFSPNIELAALNEAVGEVKQQLNDPGFKEKVVITIPGLNNNTSSFGAVGGSGQSLDLNPNDVGQVQATVNKAKAIRWYINQVQSQWRSAGLSNLQLAGFYWEPESMQPTAPLDAELIQATAAMVHQNHLKFYWIPTYGAPGVSYWKQLGFDDVTSQAGVAFNDNIDAATRLKSVSDMAQYYNLGLEMEQPYNTTSTNQSVAQAAQNKFYDYFTGGYLYGYEGDTMKTWYLNSKGLLPAYQSSDPFYHQEYDNTLAFVNNEWKETTFY